MKKNIITIINIISATPILLYPFALIAGAMSFDAPDSAQHILPWFLFLFSTLYPVFIIAFLIISRKKNSLLFASIALIPLLFIIFAFLFSGGLAKRDAYYTRSKDFVCNSNSFLWVEKNGNFGGVNLFEKKNFYTYGGGTIASIDNGNINIISDNPKKARDLLSNCKNNEGKTLLDFYTLISK